MKKSFTVVLSEKQLNTYRDALEFYSRFLAGQIEHLPPVLDTTDISWEHLNIACNRLKKVLFPDLYPNESRGIGNIKEKKDLESSIAYEMYREVYVYQTKINNVHNVYSSPTLKVSDEPMPTIIPNIDIGE